MSTNPVGQGDVLSFRSLTEPRTSGTASTTPSASAASGSASTGDTFAAPAPIASTDQLDAARKLGDMYPEIPGLGDAVNSGDFEKTLSLFGQHTPYEADPAEYADSSKHPAYSLVAEMMNVN